MANPGPFEKARNARPARQPEEKTKGRPTRPLRAQRPFGSNARLPRHAGFANHAHMSRTPVYKGGMDAVIAQYEGRRDPFEHRADEGLPPADLDLVPLTQSRITPPKDDPRHAPPFRSALHRKTFQIREELTGASDLCALNALLISHLRKRSAPPETAVLFQRLWAEQGAHLLAELDPRWLVSSITTFGDHGTTTVQRSVGLALTVLFGMMKLYETERLYSGTPSDKAFVLDGKIRGTLPMAMNSYSLVNGGLDVNLLGRLWQEAEDDVVIQPLAHHLLDMLIHDPNTLFRRLRVMSQRKTRREKDDPAAKPRRSNIAPVPATPLDPRTLRWGLVSTVKAPLDRIARFAAYHLDLGAHALHLYLDEPDEAAARYLTQDPRVTVTQCDATYWERTGKKRTEAHQLRQAHNATRSLRASAGDLDWLGHIDVDEFILTDRPMPETLAAVPPGTAITRLPPAEALAPAEGDPCHFKLTHKQAGVKKAQLQDIYPTFGLHLYGGFLSHTSGKVFARTGIADTRLGIHTLKHMGEDATNRFKPAGLYLAHLHAPSWEHFRNHLKFRQEKGSYRARADRPELGQAALLRFLSEEGEDALRSFFDEVCADTPRLREALSARGMLLTRDLDLDGAVRRVYGALP